MSKKKADHSKSIEDKSPHSEEKSKDSKHLLKKGQQSEQKQSEKGSTDANTVKSATTQTTETEAPAKGLAAQPASTSSGKGQKGNAAPIWLNVTVVLLIILAGAVWYVYSSQERFKKEFQQQLQSQLSDTQQSRQKIDLVTRQFERSQQALKQAQAQISLLEDQVGDLSQAFQVMTDSGTELMLLNDIAHFIDLAQQQLLVGGNVSNAIIPLETAQARLVRSDRQGLAILLQAINGDLDRLRAVEKLDMPATLKQLQTLQTWLAEAPLLTPQDEDIDLFRPQTATQKTVPSRKQRIEQEWWEEGVDIAQNWAQQAWSELRAELGELISVRRVDDATVLLMTPEQIQGLREHIRLRISMAQLALMTQQNEVWQMELDTLLRLVEKRFDLTAAPTQRAMGLIRQLQALNVHPQLPTLDNTLAAVENLRQHAAQQASSQERRDLQAEAKVVEQLKQEGKADQGMAPAVSRSAEHADHSTGAAAPSVGTESHNAVAETTNESSPHIAQQDSSLAAEGSTTADAATAGASEAEKSTPAVETVKAEQD